MKGFSLEQWRQIRSQGLISCWRGCLQPCASRGLLCRWPLSWKWKGLKAWELLGTRLLTKHELLVQLAGTDVNNRAVTSVIAASKVDCSAAPHIQTSHTDSSSLLFHLRLHIRACTKCPLQTLLLTCVSLVFGVDFLIEEVLSQQVEFSILFSDSMCPDKLELLQCKLIELVLHLPNGGLLQLGDRLLRGWLLLAGLSQVGFLPCDEGRSGLKGSGACMKYSCIYIHICSNTSNLTEDNNKVTFCLCSYFLLVTFKNSLTRL